MKKMLTFHFFFFFAMLLFSQSNTGGNINRVLNEPIFDDIKLGENINKYINRLSEVDRSISYGNILRGYELEKSPAILFGVPISTVYLKFYNDKLILIELQSRKNESIKEHYHQSKLISEHVEIMNEYLGNVGKSKEDYSYEIGRDWNNNQVYVHDYVNSSKLIIKFMDKKKYAEAVKEMKEPLSLPKEGPILTFLEKEVTVKYDYIRGRSSGLIECEFINSGETPLLITHTSVKYSKGIPNYNTDKVMGVYSRFKKGVIMPGEKGIIEVVYPLGKLMKKKTYDLNVFTNADVESFNKPHVVLPITLICNKK